MPPTGGKVYKFSAADDAARDAWLEAIEAALLSLTQDRPLPHVFVRGQLLGGSAEMQEAAATGLLYELLEESVLPPKGCVVPTRGKGPK